MQRLRSVAAAALNVVPSWMAMVVVLSAAGGAIPLAGLAGVLLGARLTRPRGIPVP